MDDRRLVQFVRDRAADLDPVARAIASAFVLPVWVNFKCVAGEWLYCCAKYGGPGASVFEKSADFAAAGKRLASEHRGVGVLFVSDEAHEHTVGLCFGPDGEFLAFQAGGFANVGPKIMQASLLDVQPALDVVSRAFEGDAPAVSRADDSLAELSEVVDDALTMAGVTGTRASIFGDAVKAAVGRALRAAQSHPYLADAADTACTSFIAAVLAQQRLVDETTRLAEEAKESKQADKRLAKLAKEHETLKAVSEGYRKRAERQSLEILDLQRKLRAARDAVPVAAPDDLAQRLAPLYGMAVS